MSAPRSILFVCTENVFRSVAAEGCFKKYLLDNGIENWRVGSAGTLTNPESIDPKVRETLLKLGIDASAHTQRRLTQEMLGEYDAVVAMAEDHIAFMQSHFYYKNAVLFNDLAMGEQISIWDVKDEVPDHLHNRPAVEEKLERTVRDIHTKTSALYKNAVERFYP